MTKISTLHKRWMKDPAYKGCFEAVGPEFELAQKLIHARAKSGLSQGELVERMGTSQPSIARMESGTV